METRNQTYVDAEEDFQFGKPLCFSLVRSFVFVPVGRENSMKTVK